MLVSAAFAEFRGNERGNQTYIEKTIGQNASHLGKPHISKALQYALAAYYLMPADYDFDRVRNLFIGFTMGKRAGGSYNSIEGKTDDRVHIGKSWKMAFAAYMLTKEKDHDFILKFMYAGYMEGRKKDLAVNSFMQGLELWLKAWTLPRFFQLVVGIIMMIVGFKTLNPYLALAGFSTTIDSINYGGENPRDNEYSHPEEMNHGQGYAYVVTQ
ncbi:hypothetical protein [Leptospira soteropolitanensis]|uniref:hypothetical protein n=1 Tax=Leptospira soteropolitanensis TaxID=2950025 RepID=UPI00223DBA68|nr:hypothetical protein [Leptospira soteropolitanensis]MCW7521598.1 hypothetical protein [Leptospira soteropolitanensis]